MSSNQLGRIVTSAVLVGAVGTAEANWPGLPEVHDLSVYGTTSMPLAQGNHAWDGDAMPGIGFELGFFVEPTRKQLEDAKRLRETWLFVDAVAGFTYSSMHGDMTDSLRARASLRETYLGIGVHLEPEGWPVGFFGGANLRLFSLGSGRAYDTQMRDRPAYKLSGEGAGAALTGGVAIGDYFYVELSLTSRFVPSVVLDPPTGVAAIPTLPADAPERMAFHSFGITAGLSFPFAKD